LKIGVLGAGGWGTALSILLHQNRHQVTLWEYREEVARRLFHDHENQDFLPGVRIPGEIEIISDLEQAVIRKDVIVITLPSHTIRSVGSQISHYPLGKAVLVSGSKGIENDTLLRISEILKVTIPTLVDDRIVALSGLITRGLVEMTRLGSLLGADPLTFAGLSGMGDLIVTCTSHYSRNRSVGEKVGKGEKLEDVLQRMVMVAEGVKTTRSAYALSRKYRISMPITCEIYHVLFEEKDPKQAMYDLMTRDPKSENWG